MPAVRVFEPALCCNTGVCGPDVDQSLIDFTAALGAVRDAGGDVERANLASDPAAFTADPTALGFLQTAGSQGLPLTVVDGVTVLTGRYPSREELSRWAGLDVAPAPAVAGTGTMLLAVTDVTRSSGGCCGSEGCC